MNDPTALDIGGFHPGPSVPEEPPLVDTVRELPAYFPSTRSPEQWADWLRASYNQEWSAYAEKRKVFEREHRQWQVEKADMERKRDELARLNILRIWISLREEVWEAERRIWTAEKTALLPSSLEDEMVDEDLVYAVSQASRSIEKAKKKKAKKKQLVNPAAFQLADRVPVEGTLPHYPVDASVLGPEAVDPVPVEGMLPYEPVDVSVSATVDPMPAEEMSPYDPVDAPVFRTIDLEVPVEERLPYSPVGASTAGQLDTEGEALQRRMEEESVASEVTVLQLPSVTDRLHRMLIMLKRQMEDLPEGTPETTQKSLERLARKHERQLLRRHNAGAAMAEFLDLFSETDDGFILMDNRHPRQVETIIEEKLETILSPSAKSIKMSFQLAKKAKDASRQKTNAIQLLERYGLFFYTIEDPANKKRMTINVPEAVFESWVLSYRERTSRGEQRTN